MKKVILGTGLIICGVLGILTYILVEAIYHASPNSILRMGGGTDPYLIFAIILLILGIVLNVFGFCEDSKK